MESLTFARRCARAAVLVALTWSGLFLYQRIRSLGIADTAKLLDDKSGLLAWHTRVCYLRLLWVALLFPVLASLRASLRRQEETYSTLAFGFFLLAAGFLIFADASQILVLPSVAGMYLDEMETVFTETPRTDLFDLLYLAFPGSLPAAAQAIGHVFLAGSLITFGGLLAQREKTIAGFMVLAGCVALGTHVLIFFGYDAADFGFFGVGLLVAAVMALLARKYGELLRKREKGY
jgi:hypothetical protein